LTINGNGVAATARDAAAIATAIGNASSDVTAVATNTSTTTFNSSVSATIQAATTLNVGAYTVAASNGTAAVTSTTAVSGGYTTSIAAGGATETYSITVDGVSAFAFTSTPNTAAASAVSGAFTDSVQGAGETYSLTVDGVSVYTETNGTITAAEVQGGLTAASAALTSAGITVSGTVAGGDLAFSRLDGTSFNIVVVNDAPSNGFAGGDFATGTNVIAAGSTPDDVTAAEVDVGITAATTALNAAGITVAGTAAAGNLVFSRADGAAFNVVVANTFSGTTGGLAGGNFATGTNSISNGTTAVAVTDSAFTLTLDGATVYNELAGIGVTVTAGELDTALSTFVGASGGAYSISSGTIAGNDLVLSKADGSDVSLAIASNFSTTAGAFGGSSTAASTNGTTVAGATAPDYTFTIDGAALDFTTDGADGTITGTEIAGLINALSDYTSSYSGTSLTITKADGSNIVLVESGTDAAGAEGVAGLTQTLYGTVAITSTSNNLVIGGATASNAGLTVGTTALASTGVTVANTDISNVSGANAAIVTIDAALNSINSSRGDLGAIQSRFESVVSSLSTTAENLSAARSRIQDTDFAAETANLTKAQILQQAGISILSQANAQPQLVLSLLQ